MSEAIDLEPAERRRITGEALSVAVATGAYAISFGAISTASGLSVAQTCALSLLMFTGASQFAFVGVIAAGGTAFSAAATATLLGTRNAFYGLKVAPLLGWRGWRRITISQFVIDETTALSINRPTRAAARWGFGATAVLLFTLWNLGTLIGAVAGAAVGDPRTYGLDAAVGAAFLALIWPRLCERRSLAVAAGAAGVALALVSFTPVGVPVLAAAGVAVLAGLLRSGEA